MFVHLHVHSPYSFMDGASSIEDLVQKAAYLGMPSLAITDHNNVTAAVKLTEAAEKAGIRPIVGAEVTLEGGSHMTLLCQGAKGYKNLCAILSEAHLSNERKKPKVSMENLERRAEGLIAMTGCRRGLVPSLVLRKRYDEARDALRKYKAIFGRTCLFVELSESLLPGSLGLARHLRELALAEGLGIVATNNVHYASREDFVVHDVLTCVRTLTKLEDVHPERRLNAENYLKSEEEMGKAFRDFPEALLATKDIAARCDPPLRLGESNFPSFCVPTQFPSPAAYLKHLSYTGAESRYGKVTEKIRGRLEHELGVILELGYEDYFLAVWDLVAFAKKQGIRHAGRGSAADSAVAYCLGVTDVDPIAQNLLFERFLSVERGEKPDIDVDFDSRSRDDVSGYVRSRYGEEHVAAVATYNTFQGRSAIRDAGKVMGYHPDELDIIAKRLPHYVSPSRLPEQYGRIPELRDLGIPEGRLRTLLRAAQGLSGLPRFLSTHLGGIVISKNPISHLSPVEMSAKGVTILQFDKDDVEALGLVKIDLLSLRTLGAVQDSLGYLEDEGKALDYDKIPIDDSDTYKRLGEGETIGVFQLESSAQRALQSRLGAKNIEDIVASVALIRPGPIKGNMVDPYVKRRLGQEPVTYLDPRLEPILKKTYGVVLFQEQVIEIASTIAGFTAGEADMLRRVMTHMRSGEEMESIGKLFVERAAATGVPPETAEAIFACMRGYASYGFCEAHARAFGTTAYKTAYLIEHHPAEFFAAILNNGPMGFYPPSTICVEAGRRGVKVTGPSVNRSGSDVRVERGEIVLPFKMIGGISKKVLDAIATERKMGPFGSFGDFAARVRPPLDVLRSMVLAGVFDEFGASRKKLLWSIPEKYSHGTFDSGAFLVDDPEDRSPGDWSDFSLAEKIGLEYETLGFSVSGHPMTIWRKDLSKKGFIVSKDLKDIKPGEFVKVGGIPIRPHRPPTKSGKTVVFLSLEDESGLIDVTCFEAVYKKYGRFLFPGELLPIGMWGQVQKRGSAYSVTARTVFPLSDALGSSIR